MATIDIDKFNEYAEKKLITRREHPSANLLIWNYTPLVQYSKAWDDVTLAARGLITDYYGQIIARPFTKFFNYGEYQGEIPDERPSVSEKMDGSLGILYKTRGEYAIATRGSFESDQAAHGTQLLQKYIAEHGDGWILPEFTYLFEIIYPSNRVVVDYGKRDELVLLALIETETGKDAALWAVNHGWRGAEAQGVDSESDLAKLAEYNNPNQEGYVVKFSNGLRLKVKFQEYVRLHRLLTNISSKVIWELLKDGKTIEEIIDNVPDEFFDWVTAVKDNLIAQHDYVVATVNLAASQVPEGTQKEKAAWILENHKDISGMVFNAIAGKDFEDAVWKRIKPAHELPFRKDIDA